MDDYIDANGDIVWESHEFDDLIHEALVRRGWLLPTTVEEVLMAEEEMKDEPDIELPRALRDPYELMRRRPDVFGTVRGEDG